MRKRKTVKIAIGYSPESNRFKGAKVKQFVPRKKCSEQSRKTGLDFEQFLWDNASAEFYNAVKDAINKR